MAAVPSGAAVFLKKGGAAMLIKATESFSGTVTMAKGDTRDIPEGDVLSDLLRAGLVEAVQSKSKKKKDTETGDDNETE